MLTLTDWMDSRGVNLNQLSELAKVTWRTARNAREGKLDSASTARGIADAIGRDALGVWIVDPASMMSQSLDPGAAA